MAKPVRMQGAFTLVLIGLLLVVVGALVYVLISIASTPSEPETAGGGGRPAPSTEPADVGEAPPEVNPFVPNPDRPAILHEVGVEPPVAYLLDTGGSMSPIFNWAVDLVRASVISLGKDNTAIVVALKDYSTDGATTLFDGAVSGGKATSTKLMEWSETVYPSGPTDPAIPQAVTAAMQIKPKTVALITRQAIDNEKAIEALAKVKPAGGKLLLIAVGPDRIDREAHVKLADKLGATYRWVPGYRLRELRDQAEMD
ncbi:MAG: hypothetical protein ACLFV7_03405 [Phycisphaerae bacterium]